jgi:transposase
MGSNFRALDRDTPFLLPPSLQDWLPEKHLARFIVDVVSQLDLKPIRAQYAGRGSQAYQPEMMLALLCYGYATGVFSSRKLERATYDSVAFRFITANQHPEHDTISDFRRRFLPFVTKLFEDVLRIAAESGVLKVGRVSVDGTKVKANASKHHALSYKHAGDLEQRIKQEVADLLELAEKADNEKNDDGMDIPEEIARREDRLEAIAEAKKRIEEREKARIESEQAEHEEKRARWEEKEKQKMRCGKKPVAPSAEINPQAQINLTDEESRIMPAAGGGFVQGYNAQNAVDCDSRFVVSSFVSQSPNDMSLLEETVQSLNALPEVVGKVAEVLADAGYFSGNNIDLCESASVTPYISDHREPHSLPLQALINQPDLATDANSMDRARHRIRTKEGRKIYALRKSTVEPVFGIIKSATGFRSFLLRTLEKVQAEWRLVCTAYNLRRLHVLAK